MNELNDLKCIEIINSLQERLISIEIAVKSGKMSESDATRHLKFIAKTVDQVTGFATHIKDYISEFKNLAKGTLEKVQSEKLP